MERFEYRVSRVKSYRMQTVRFKLCLPKIRLNFLQHSSRSMKHKPDAYLLGWRWWLWHSSGGILFLLVLEKKYIRITSECERGNSGDYDNSTPHIMIDSSRGGDISHSTSIRQVSSMLGGGGKWRYTYLSDLVNRPYEREVFASNLSRGRKGGEFFWYARIWGSTRQSMYYCIWGIRNIQIAYSLTWWLMVRDRPP